MLELSLNYDLTDNAVRIHLPRSIKPSLVFTEQQAPLSLAVVVATSETIHRFIFEHPSSLPVNIFLILVYLLTLRLIFTHKEKG